MEEGFISVPYRVNCPIYKNGVKVKINKTKLRMLVLESSSRFSQVGEEILPVRIEKGELIQTTVFNLPSPGQYLCCQEGDSINIKLLIVEYKAVVEVDLGII